MDEFDDVLLPGQSVPTQASPPAEIAIQPPPVAATAPVPPAQRRGIGYVVMALSFSTVLFAFLWIRLAFPDGYMPEPGPGPGPDKKSYVVMFYDDKEKNEYSQEAIDAMDSDIVARWLDENVDRWEKIDVDLAKDLAQVNEAFAAIVNDSHRSKLPWVTVRVKGRNVGNDQIEDPDQLLELLKRTVK